MTSEEHAEVKRLRREVAELRRANEILKAAATFLGAELCATRRQAACGAPGLAGDPAA